MPIDILSPAVRADPYPHYAELRRTSPVCQVEPGGMWAVSKYDDIVAVLRDPVRCSSQGFAAVWEPAWVGYNPLARSLLARDAPGHTRLRTLASRSLGPRAVERLRPAIVAKARELTAAIDGEVEIVEALAAPLPAFVIGTLLGLDPALWVRFKRWADDFLSVTPEPPRPEHAARVRTTISELCEYLRTVIAARREQPRDDTVSDLVVAEVDGERLGDAEILEFLVVLLLGGLETTTHLIASSALLLAREPALLSRLRADPGLVAAFVEEMLRFDGPSQSLPRFTTTAVTLSGVTIPAGALVLALVGSAGRDETRFVEPDRFDLTRGTAGLNFGHGPHFCLGAALARMEAQIAVDALIRRARAIEPPVGPVEYNRTMTVRGPVAADLRVRV